MCLDWLNIVHTPMNTIYHVGTCRAGDQMGKWLIGTLTLLL